MTFMHFKPDKRRMAIQEKSKGNGKILNRNIYFCEKLVEDGRYYCENFFSYFKISKTHILKNYCHILVI